MPNTTSFATAFGPMALVWRPEREGTRIEQLLLPRPDGGAASLPSAAPRSCPAIDDLIALLLRYLAGEPITLPLELAALESCSPFQQRVLRADHAIPRGMVSSYGLIAAHLGIPGAARAVGRALATNPFPILIPCHRAVRSDGTLGGYQGGLPMKRALLEMEGVAINPAGRVSAVMCYAR
jgi:methylated-DNA-[protein]-cysteine S-methyltransferase